MMAVRMGMGLAALEIDLAHMLYVVVEGLGLGVDLCNDRGAGLLGLFAHPPQFLSCSINSR